MKNPYDIFLTLFKDELLLEKLKLTDFAVKHGVKLDQFGWPVAPKKKKMKTSKDNTKGRGTAGFRHSDLVGAHIGTEVLKRQRTSGQHVHDVDSATTEITPDAPTLPHQKQIDFGVHGKRKPFTLNADHDKPRSETDTVRFSYSTKIASANNNTHGIKDDGHIITHIWDHNSGAWKDMRHELEYGQGQKQWIRRNATTEGKARQETDGMTLKREAIDALSGLGKKTTWGHITAAWGEKRTKEVADPDTHFVHFDHSNKTFSVIRIGDLHPDTPLTISRQTRSAEHDRKASADNGIRFNMSRLMKFQQSTGRGKHGLSSGQLLDHFAEIHKAKLQEESKTPLKEWLYSHLEERGLIL